MRILIVIDSLGRGGKERRLIELLRSFNSVTDISVKLVVMREQVEYQEVYQLKHTTTDCIVGKFKRDPRMVLSLRRICKEFKPDLIHSWSSMSSVYAVPVSRMLKIPLVNAMVANAKCKPFTRDWTRSRITFPFSHIIVSNSYAGIKAYKVKPEKARVIYNGYNFERNHNTIDVEKLRKKINCAGKTVVTMIAAFHPRKDYDTFCTTAKEMSNSHPDVFFLAIGGGPALTDFKTRWGDQKNLHFTGQVDNVEDYIQITDIGVLLTNPDVHQEGIPNTVMELMAFGKPVIATSGGGTDELVEHRISGILIPPHSATELRNNIDRLINLPGEAIQLGERAKHRIADSFSIARMSEATLALYREVIGQKSKKS